MNVIDRESGKFVEYTLAVKVILDSLSRSSVPQHEKRIKAELDSLDAQAASDVEGLSHSAFHALNAERHLLFLSIIESLPTHTGAAEVENIRSLVEKSRSLASEILSQGIVKRRMASYSDHNVTDGPVFVISSWRSGSTLLMSALDTHPSLTALPENNLLDAFLEAPSDGTGGKRPLLYRQRPALIRAYNSVAQLSIDEATFYGGFSEFVDSVFSPYLKRKGGRRWVYKEIVNSGALSLIDALFGYKAKFIWLVRHGLDVVNSHIERYEQNGPQCADIAEYAIEWSDKNRLFANFYDRTGDRCLRVRYEDLISDPVREMQCIFGFLGERYDYDLLSRMELSSASLGGDHKFTQTGGKIDSLRVGRWRSWPQAYVQQFGTIVNPMLCRAGYDPI
jgi:hypothetical protein